MYVSIHVAILGSQPYICMYRDIYIYIFIYSLTEVRCKGSSGGSKEVQNGAPGGSGQVCVSDLPCMFWRRFLMNVSAFCHFSTLETSILSECLSDFGCFRFWVASLRHATGDFDAQARGF